MQTNGVCPLEKRDSVCFTIKHPLSYYRKGLRRQQWLADRDAARDAATPAQRATDSTETTERKSVQSVKSVAGPSSGAQP
jgi:hypothetical protein